ncbi:MAG: hypothetical protein Q8L26_08210 [Candidatus Omnitrophota bacterium]|nr:hypothetical protein [Candidatus Omnitrophota bacterium]
MKSKIFIAFTVVILNSAIAFAQTTEDITITTYYPSPFGVYGELRSDREAIGATYSNDTNVCWGSAATCPFGSVVIPTVAGSPDVDLVVEGSVGIGTANPRSPAPNAQPGNLDVNDVWLRGAVPPRWASQGGVLDYSTCYQKQIGSPTGPHTGYCRQGYINVGGTTDGNDWIPESIVCCELQGITTVNWNTRPIWGANCTNNPC